MADSSARPLPSLDDIDTVNKAAEVMLNDLELAEMTLRTYRHGLDALLRFLHYREGDDAKADNLAPYPLDGIDEETLYAFSRWLRKAYPDPRTDEGKGTRTTQTYLVAARRLMNWLDLHELLPQDVSYDRMVRRVDQGRGSRRDGYQQRRVDPNVTRVISHYLEKPLPKKRGGPRRLALLRNRALMAVLYDTAARISEALALTREDVLDGRAHKVRLTETKNGKPRTVFLSEESQELIKAYVAERDDSIYAPLFVSHGRNKGTAITPAYAWELVKKAAPKLSRLMLQVR